jgi:hypothetical protein
MVRRQTWAWGVALAAPGLLAPGVAAAAIGPAEVEAAVRALPVTVTTTPISSDPPVTRVEARVSPVPSSVTVADPATAVDPSTAPPAGLVAPGGQVTLTVPLQTRVRWSAHDASGAELDPMTWRAKGTLDGPVEQFFLSPVPREDNRLTRRLLRARLTITATPPGLPPLVIERTLPDVPVLVPALPVPNVLVLFREPSFRRRLDLRTRTVKFEGPTLVVLTPGAGPREGGPLARRLRNLAEFMRRDPKLFPGYSALDSVSALEDAARGIERAASYAITSRLSIPSLNDHDIERRLFPRDDVEAEDEISSMILVGAPGTRVRLYVNRGCQSGRGQLDLTVG